MTALRFEPEVCIVGGGLAGGVVAAYLGEAGVRTVVLEAGPYIDRDGAWRRFQNGEFYVYGLVPAERELYDYRGDVGLDARHSGVKAVGGATLAWLGNALRLHENDFKTKSTYGVGEDWPIGYEDLEPYYAKAEKEMGVAGRADNPWAGARSTDFPMQAFPFSYSDKLIKRACDRIGIRIHSMPQARNSVEYDGRDMCCSASTCIPVCPTTAKYSADIVHIARAERTGNVQVITDAQVTRLELDKTGNVAAAIYADLDRSEHRVEAGVFVVAANSVEIPRLLLLSTSSRFPNGLANGSGFVGKCLMDHPQLVSRAEIGEPLFPFRGPLQTAQSHQFYDVEWRGEASCFKLELNNRAGMDPKDIAVWATSYGADLRDEVRRKFGRAAQLTALHEMLPRETNTVALHPDITDYYGNPIASVRLYVRDYERRGFERSAEVVRRIFEALGAVSIEVNSTDPGSSSHMLGTCRMGNDPARSVVDSNLRTHEVPNLYLVGGCNYVTAGAANPALTTAALAIRLADFLLRSAG